MPLIWIWKQEKLLQVQSVVTAFKVLCKLLLLLTIYSNCLCWMQIFLHQSDKVRNLEMLFESWICLRQNTVGIFKKIKIAAELGVRQHDGAEQAFTWPFYDKTTSSLIMILNSDAKVYEKNHVNPMETKVKTLPSVICLIWSGLGISLFLFLYLWVFCYYSSAALPRLHDRRCWWHKIFLFTAPLFLVLW